MNSDRFVRMLVFFDLPTLTIEDRRNYTKFRKMLVKNGFIMLQESVYCRMLTTESSEKSVEHIIMKNKPRDGIVQMLRITEKQFAKIKFIVGESVTDIVNNNERLIIL